VRHVDLRTHRIVARFEQWQRRIPASFLHTADHDWVVFIERI
jgi:hypothetical protein